MNEKIAEKLGMAMALCSLGAETIRQYKSILSGVKPDDELEKERETFEDHTRRSEQLADREGMADAAKQAYDEADEIFRTMQDAFLADREDEPDRLLGWLGIANAGGIAIWAFLEGAADAAGHEDLKKLSEEALEFQKGCLEKGEKLLIKLGTEQAKESA